MITLSPTDTIEPGDMLVSRDRTARANADKFVGKCVIDVMRYPDHQCIRVERMTEEERALDTGNQVK